MLSAAEAVQAAKLHSEMPPEQQAIMLSVGGPGTATCWTAMHKSPTELHRMRNGGWPRRYGSVQRRMQACDPRVLCGKAMMKTCASNLWRRTRSTRFAASTVEPGPDRTVQSSTPCAGPSSKQGATRTWNAMSLSSTTG